MKSLITQWAVYSILILLLDCSPKLILKSTVYNGKENIVAREYEYNTKTKTITTVYNNKTTKNKFIIEPKQNRLFIEKLKKIGVSNNFCWISSENYPNYSYKYEIIFSNKAKQFNCQKEHIKSEIYNLFYEIRDSIKNNKILN